MKTIYDCKSGKDIVTHTARQGFDWRTGKGSHAVGRKGNCVVVVPLHRELKRGTRASIIKALVAAGVTLFIVAVLLQLGTY